MSENNKLDFDWRETARLETEMWRAYYNHQFLRLFWLLVRLAKTQLRVGWLRALRIAYYSGWAAADYRIHKRSGVNERRVIKNLTKFFKLYGTVLAGEIPKFDYRKAAELEFKWWEIHRRSHKNSAELENAVAETYAVVYSIDPKHFMDYAHYRSEAGFLPEHVGDKQRGRKLDWSTVQTLIEKSYHALHTAVNKGHFE